MKNDITSLLRDWRNGNVDSRDRLVELVYGTLRQIAAARLAGVSNSATLRPTALVHEAMMRMLHRDISYNDRAHFFALISLKMRDVLVEYARARTSAKRGGGASEVTLSHVGEGDGGGVDREYEILALHQALVSLGKSDRRAARIVELTYFGGMKHGEIAVVLGISVPTVERDLRFAKAWLSRELSQA